MVVPMEQWASQPFQDKSADLWVVLLSDHNEKYSDRMESSYKAFAVTYELRFPFPLTITPPNSITVKWDEKSQAMAIPHRLCVCACVYVCVCLSVCRYFIYVKYPSAQRWQNIFFLSEYL